MSTTTREDGRRTFVLSRGLEYFTEGELQMQMGAGKDAWPIALLKELVDNALDAAESAGAAPEIEIEIADAGFAVRDNGPGIPAETLEHSLDYMVRVSDKLGYVTPTRGRLGNALKVLWAAPFVATGSSKVCVRAGGLRHDIAVRLDRIEQRPVIDHVIEADSWEAGTGIRVHWPESACLLAPSETSEIYKTTPTARELMEAFAAFNPHATFRLDGAEIAVTRPDWRKWKPTARLVAHWYTPETFRDLIANYVASERYGQNPCTVRAFVSRFRGLSSTGRQKAVTEGFQREYLNDLASDGELDRAALAELLDRMKELSKPPRPGTLGVIGKDHLTAWMVSQGDVASESIRYRRKTGTEGALPYVVEVAFGIRNNDEAKRRIITGLNWSPTLAVPVREINAIVQEMRLDRHDPVVLAVHMARPEWNYTERGKGTVEL